MNKISSKKFNQVHDSLGALKLIASSLTSDSDILSSFCVLAFDEVPNRNFTTKEYISRKADAKNGLNLVQKHLIAKEVSKLLKDASAFYDSELPSLVKTQADFKRPENVKVFKTAKFGDVALVGNKYHLVNPLTKTVTAEYVEGVFTKEAAPTVPFADSENEIVYENADYVITLTTVPTIPENIGDTAAFYTIKSNLGKGTRGGIVAQCVVVVNETGYALQGLKRYPEELEPSKLSEDTLMEAYSIVQKDYSYRAAEADKSVNASAKVTAKVDFNKLLQNKTFKDADDLENTIKSFVAGGKVLEDDADGFTIEALEEDGKHTYKVYLIGNGGPSEEVRVEKVEELTAQEEKPVEKKAEEKIDFEKELMEAGESKGEKDKVNKEQLEMGKKVEKEHTTNPEIAEKITRDHLAEIPDYYTHLEEMENNAKKNNEVKSSYAPFITIDATTTDEVKVVAGEKVVGTCKTIQAAFEKTADWSSEEVLIDDGTGVTVTYQVYDDESELPVVWAALRHRDNGNVIMCSDAVYVGDLLGAEDHIDFIKDIKDFSKEFAKVGLGEEKVKHYQDQTNAKLKEIFQSKPELGAQSSAKPEVKKEAGESYGWVVNSEDAWNKLMLWEETVGAEQALRDVAKAIGDEELSECLAYIFRMNDFKQGCSDTDEDSDVESSKKENIEKKADEELKQFDMKQELDGQKEFEKQDDFSQVSVPEENEDTSEVNEAMEAKPEETKGESFSASEFGNNMAYIQQNNPDAFKSIMNNLKQIMVGDQQKIYNFLENWSSHNFQDFTAMTREDPTYARHSQYQEQLKNNVLPKLKEMSEYKQAMEEKVSAEKGNVEASIREYDSSDPEDAAVYNHNGEGEGEED